MAEEWRQIVSALADPVRRAVYASVVLGVEREGAAVPVDPGTPGTPGIPGIPAKKRERALAALVRAGLIEAAGDGYVAAESGLRDLLAASATPTRAGVDRFVRDGRIEQYPARPADRDALLAWAAGRVVAQDEALSEKEINARLEEMTGDVATLRRYLVDARLISRSADGAKYRRA
jgi:hypothetical protein